MLDIDFNFCMALRLDGKKLAREFEKRLFSEIQTGLKGGKRPPGLAVIRVGDDPASSVYVANKEKACARVGLTSFLVHLPSSVSSDEVMRKIYELNENNLVDGILLQLPLPKGIEEGPLLAAIDPGKDADGLHSMNLGRLLKGEHGPRSCTPAGVMALLSHYQITIERKRALVVGRSILVGQPMALMLQAANATVSVAHSFTEDLEYLTKQAEILVVAAGQPEMIGAEHIRPGAVVVDVGIHRLPRDSSLKKDEKSLLCGDVRSQEAESLASALTPVPGGVGPMTVTMLLVNTVSRWQYHCGLSFTLKDLLP